MRYEVLIGRSATPAEYRPGDEIVTVTANGGLDDVDAAFQAGITLALGRPASRLRGLVVKAVRSEDGAAAS